MRLPQPELKRARIEIVPMIDTIFFLLVFFMVTSMSMVALHAKKVDLPESETAKLKPKNQVTISVDAKGLYYVDQQNVSADAVQPRLAEVLRRDPDTEVVLNCDKSLPIPYFHKIFDFAKKANAAHVMISTAPRSAKGGL